MKQMIVLGMCAALALAGACGKSGDKAGATSSGDSSMDKATFDKLTGGIHPDDAWASASAQLDKALGPAKVKKDDHWTWAAAGGSDCWSVKLFKNGDKVAGITGEHTAPPMGELYEKCVARAKGTQP